jgi:molybdenum-pterin binding domain
MSALDVTARREMRRLVARRAAEEGLTVLLVTHDVLDITALAEDIAVLENGRVAERGTTAKVLAAPVSDFAARLTGTAVLTGGLAGDDEAPALKLDEGQVVHGRPRSDDGDGEGAGESLCLGGPGIALVPPDAVALYREPPQGSPRNVLAGRVSGVDRAGALVSVEVRLAGGQTIRAAVTAGAVAEMGIAVDQELWCAIKAVEVRIVPRRERDSAAPVRAGTEEESAAKCAE